MKILVVGNPVAGRGRGRRAARALAASLEARGHDVTCALTGEPGAARRQVAALDAGLDRIVAAGGDGTLNEIVNGLRAPAAIPLVPMPLGTANMMARELGVPRAPAALADWIERGQPRRVDLGRIGDRRFLSLAGAGFDALVTETLRGSRRGALGYRGYALPILSAIARYREPRLRVAVDDAPPVACGFVVVSHIGNYGGIFRVTPDATPDSGALEVCRFHRASVPHLAGAVPFALAGALARLPGIDHARGRRIRIESDAPAPVQVDGDYLGETPVTIELEPRAATLLAAPG